MKKHKVRFVTPQERLQLLCDRTYTERFDMLMRLIRMGKLLSEAGKRR